MVKVNNRNFTIGADPELFVKKKKEKENFFWCADGLIPGSKEEPFKVKGGAIQVDGMAVEFNINPVKTKLQFESNIKSVVTELRKYLGPDYSLWAVPVANFREKDFDEAPKKAKILGCEPDWNAYKEDINPAPDSKHKFRTGAGHIHIGWGSGFDTRDPNLLDACFHLVKFMDKNIGEPLSSVSGDWKRRELYGDLGAFRPKSYGLEYRTPSNFWLTNRKLTHWVWDQTVKSLQDAFKGGDLKRIKPSTNIYDLV